MRIVPGPRARGTRGGPRKNLNVCVLYGLQRWGSLSVPTKGSPHAYGAPWGTTRNQWSSITLIVKIQGALT